jgi:hypothetical protein
MTLKRILTAVLTTVSIPFLSSAQGTASGDVTVRSTPEGAHITISGDVVVSGVTPARFRHLLIGDYKLVLKKHGYESYSTRVALDPTRQIEIDIRLSPKTLLKATVRSFFIPGWGQKYTDQKTKGYLIGALAIGSVLAYLAADDEFDYRYDLFLEKRNLFDSLRTAGSIDDLRRLKPELDKVQDDAYDAENVRRAAIGAIIAVLGINLLDILFFYPEQRATFSIKGLAISPTADPNRVGLTLSKRF